MITRKIVTMYGIVGIALMAVLLSLVWLEVVPRSMYVPLFLISAAIFLGRVVLRIMVARQERSSSQSTPEE